jgi:hypothetical protein
MRRPIAAAVAVVGLAGLLVPALAAPASAHEERKVGRYRFTVGFGDEPAYAGEKNSVILLLADDKDKPVTDLSDTLKVAVSTADAQPMELAVEPNFEIGEFGTPGDYRAWFIPTAPGRYTLHFTGTIKGQKVDQSFTSSPTGFDEVQDPAQVQYPTKQPTGGQLATRADREASRVDEALAATRSKAAEQASSARTIAVAGLVVGALGLLAAVGVGVLALRRRS